MIARLLYCLRSLRAYWLWLAETREVARIDGMLYLHEARELAIARHPSPRDCAVFGCLVCHARNDHSQIGRGAVEGVAILEIVRWLIANGWADVEIGELQQYACWLRRARADYEARGVLAS